MQVRLTLLLCCLSLFACDFKRQTNVDLGNQEKLLYVANGDDPAILDPQLATGLSERNILQALFEGLVSYDYNNMHALPGVARRWRNSDDARTWTFYLNPEARWSNGSPVLAEDFVFAWRRMLNPDTSANYAYMLYPLKNARALNQGEFEDFSKLGAHAIDGHTLELQLERPTPWLLQVLSHPAWYPLHRASLQRFKTGNPLLSRWTRPGNLVSNGPFVLGEWNIGDYVKVNKNPRYWNADSVKLKGIIFKAIANKNVEERAFRSEQVHLTNTPRMAIEKLAVYRKKHPDALISAPIYATIHFAFNTAREPFDNSRVRRALAHAIDRETLVNLVTKAGETPAYSFVAPNPAGFRPQQHFTYDPHTAQLLLSEAGFPNGRDFPPFELLLVNGESNNNIAVAIQQMWKENLNINMTLRAQEWKAWLHTRAAKDFDICTGSWYADYVHASNFFDVLRTNSGNNHTSWQNADYDRFLDLALVTDNRQARYRLLEKANTLLAKDMPVIPLFYPTNNNLIHPDVKNWQQNLAASMRYQNVSLAPEQ